MSLRRRDVDKWMRHRRLPVELRRCAINFNFSSLSIYICFFFLYIFLSFFVILSPSLHHTNTLLSYIIDLKD